MTTNLRYTICMFLSRCNFRICKLLGYEVVSYLMATKDLEKLEEQMVAWSAEHSVIRSTVVSDNGTEYLTGPEYADPFDRILAKYEASHQPNVVPNQVGTSIRKKELN